MTPMRHLLLIAFVLFVFAVFLTVGGLALVWTGKLRTKGLNRHALMAATLVGIAGYWLSQRSKLAVQMSSIDLGVYLVLVCVLAYIAFWLAVGKALTKKYHSHDFQESSVLSMLYVDSHREPHDFEATHVIDMPPAKPPASEPEKR
jgi:heme/copper-type cytochrome/quinol oxidase subunit 4